MTAAKILRNPGLCGAAALLVCSASAEGQQQRAGQADASLGARLQRLEDTEEIRIERYSGAEVITPSPECAHTCVQF